MPKTYTDSQLRVAVANATSIAGVLKILGLSATGGNYPNIKSAMKLLGLGSAHFVGQGWRRSKVFGPKRQLVDYLTNRVPIKSCALKNRLLTAGVFERKCYKCHNTHWLGVPIALELEHINGDSADNRIENLTLLCPNCHAQTLTYRGKNIKRATVVQLAETVALRAI